MQWENVPNSFSALSAKSDFYDFIIDPECNFHLTGGINTGKFVLTIVLQGSQPVYQLHDSVKSAKMSAEKFFAI